MIRRRLLLAGFVALALATAGRADTFQETAASVLISQSQPAAFSRSDTDPDLAPNNGLVNEIIGTSTGGYAFSNTVNNPSGGGAPGDVRTFVSVGADILRGGYEKAGGGTVIAPAVFQDSTGALFHITKVFAVSGTTVTNGSGLPVATVMSGSVAYFAIPTHASLGGLADNFVREDPRTWGAVSGSSLATPLAVFKLTTPSDITKDALAGAGTPPDKSVQNMITLNTANFSVANGTFLTKRDPSQGISNFFTFPATVIPPGNTLNGDGLLIAINENVDSVTTTNPALGANRFQFIDPAGPAGATGLSDLNTIAAGLGIDPNAAGLGFAFADAFSSSASATGTGNDFRPYGGPSLGFPTGTGDFGTVIGNSEFPGVFLAPLAGPPGVPEIDPSSLAGALTLLGGGLAYLTERRRRKKQ